MAGNLTLTITLRDNDIHFDCAAETGDPVSPSDVVGVLEMCKMMVYEDRAALAVRSGVAEPSPFEKRRARIEGARKVCLADEPLSVRAVNVLRAHGITTQDDLLRYTKRSLREFRNLGRRTLDVILRYAESRRDEVGRLAPIWYERRSLLASLSDLSDYRKFDTRQEMLDWIARENRRIREEETGRDGVSANDTKDTDI